MIPGSVFHQLVFGAVVATAVTFLTLHAAEFDAQVTLLPPLPRRY